MFRVGDTVLYGVHGVCRIIAEEERTVNRRKVGYYVLEPVEQPGVMFYVPSQNPAALSKLRKTLTESEIYALFRSDEVQRGTWIEDESARKQRFRELMYGSDRGAIIGMLRSIYDHRESQRANGRKLHVCDENFMRDAEKLLCVEFGMALNLQPEQVASFIHSQLEKNA